MNSLLHSSQLLSLRQRFFGTCTPHTPATPTLASPVALLLDWSGSRPCGFRQGIEGSNVPLAGVFVDVWASLDKSQSWLSELNSADSPRTIVAQDGSQLKTVRADLHTIYDLLQTGKTDLFFVIMYLNSNVGVCLSNSIFRFGHRRTRRALEEGGATADCESKWSVARNTSEPTN
ncbi:hypothetical protein BLNAU_10226 [Blattamonas nauphoetae]|uniref:Uncharacterized protein n=1 Tax=Blattamonas nauphoetae TaxID=2049346 RepID=A0ABQ9XTU7_9EUKA|nr:hypothetical protein BLNAU_10226 [Blattamonas nauphoetae]